MEIKGWVLFAIILFVIPYMTMTIRKPYAAMMRRKESLRTELENEIEELRQHERELVDEFGEESRKPTAEFQDELDRLRARYEKDIKELQEDHNSDTLNEILVVLTMLFCVVVGYVIFELFEGTIDSLSSNFR